MAITFRVDDVARADTPPPTRSLREHLGEVMAFGGDGERRVLTGAGANVHPLLGAVHTAFAEHRPLVLSPDAVWLTILAGVTQHVRLNAEKLRDRFVRQPGTKRLEVVVGFSLREHPEAIREVVPKFRDLIANEVGQGTARLLTCDFSTTGEVERLASEIVLLDTFSPYFEYEARCVCGIPEITLLGEVDDWRQLRERIDVIAELDLAWWTTSLAPILDEFVRASQGKPKATFFRDIYQPRDAYGGETTVGWAARFYPYLLRSGRYDLKNPLLEKPVGFRPKRYPRDTIDGISPDSVPSALGACRIIVSDSVLEANYALSVRGGLGAIEVDEEGRLAPLACWYVVEDRGSMRSVIDAIRSRADAHYEAPEPHRPSPFEDESELLELSDSFGELRLFEGAAEWRLRAPSAQVLLEIPEHRQYRGPGKRLIDLADGSCLVRTLDYRSSGHRSCIVRIHERDIEPKAVARPRHIAGLANYPSGPTHAATFRVCRERSEIPIVALSLTELFERALGCDGKLELLPLGYLSND